VEVGVGEAGCFEAAVVAEGECVVAGGALVVSLNMLDG
jgi:hypothetical protein